jgi:hypothetical protein
MATMSFLWNVPCLALPSNVITCASAANAALRTHRRNASGSGMEHLEAMMRLEANDS